jgi:4-alpha-glucanotransferase
MSISPAHDESVRDLARRAGIAVEWQDNVGRPKTVAPDVLRHILATLGLPCGTPDDLLASRSMLQGSSIAQVPPPLITAVAGHPTRLDIRATEARPARLSLEAGGARDIALAPVDGGLTVPAISETGYHRLLLDDREVVLAVAPKSCRSIDDVVPAARLWGLAAQVYSLRHRGDGGIGDAAGIAALAEAAGKRGADAVALSPLHALFSADPAHFGPYSPSTRLFLNPLHASPALVFGEAHVAGTLHAIGLSATFERLETSPLIDWPASADARHRLLRALFETFVDSPDANASHHADFARFRTEGGELLARHAVFEALHAEQFAAGAGDWHRWPTELRDPANPAVAVFAASHEREVTFHCFLQWLADRSLAIAQQRAIASGMRIGLIGDLAVGMDPAGSHAWSCPGELLDGLSVGAPPDLFNPRGQDWGLTSFSPRALVAGGYTGFLATLRAVLRNAGGVRMDHAMGMTRLWLLPQGADPADGAYLAYPLTDLLRLLALESQRHAAIVVGEDLGTVPDGFHETLETTGIHGMRVLLFERDGAAFKPPDRWDRSPVAMTSTHDLPTIAGWWHGSDIVTRAACGSLGEGVSEADAVAERDGDRPAMWQAFVQAGDAAGEAPSLSDTALVVDAALAYIATTPSPLCLVPLEDLIGMEEQPNLPGTIDQHPNWRRRLQTAAGALLDEPATARRVAQLAKRRPRS